MSDLCSWDHNPDGRVCGKPAKWMVNPPRGYWVCGVHKRSAEAIGEIDFCTPDRVVDYKCSVWKSNRRCGNVVKYPVPRGGDTVGMCTKCSRQEAERILAANRDLIWALRRLNMLGDR